MFFVFVESRESGKCTANRPPSLDGTVFHLRFIMIDFVGVGDVMIIQQKQAQEMRRIFGRPPQNERFHQVGWFGLG